MARRKDVTLCPIRVVEVKAGVLVVPATSERAKLAACGLGFFVFDTDQRHIVDDVLKHYGYKLADPVTWQELRSKVYAGISDKFGGRPNVRFTATRITLTGDNRDELERRAAKVVSYFSQYSFQCQLKWFVEYLDPETQQVVKPTTNKSTLKRQVTGGKIIKLQACAIKYAYQDGLSFIDEDVEAANSISVDYGPNVITMETLPELNELRGKPVQLRVATKLTEAGKEYEGPIIMCADAVLNKEAKKELKAFFLNAINQFCR